MGLIDTLGEIFKFFNNLFHLPSRQVQRIVRIYDAMHEVLGYTGVGRIIIVKAHNGGGLIKPNTSLYISAVYEDYTAPFESVKDYLQKLQLDEEFIRMLVDLCRQKSVMIKTSDLKDCVLKTLNEGYGVKYSEIYFLGQDRKNLYFCFCDSSVENGWYGNLVHKNIISLAINTIRNNIK